MPGKSTDTGERNREATTAVNGTANALVSVVIPTYNHLTYDFAHRFSSRPLLARLVCDWRLEESDRPASDAILILPIMCSRC